MLKCPPSPALHFWGHSYTPVRSWALDWLHMGTAHTCCSSCHRSLPAAPQAVVPSAPAMDGAHPVQVTSADIPLQVTAMPRPQPVTPHKGAKKQSGLCFGFFPQIAQQSCSGVRAKTMRWNYSFFACVMYSSCTGSLLSQGDEAIR